MSRLRVLHTVMAVSAAGGIIVIWIFWATISKTLAERGYTGADIAQLGVWGDSFGVLSSLFTALGFLGVMAGFLSQREQIRQGQQEQHKQRFDDWYFEVLKLLREARSAVRFRHSRAYYSEKKKIKPQDGNKNPVIRRYGHHTTVRVTYKGLNAFHSAWLEARRFLPEDIEHINKKVVADVYENYIHSKRESVFGPYFRLMYTILERISTDSVLSLDEKYRYGRLLRSQLTSYEVTLVGLNGLSDVSKDFDDFVIEFRLLKYVPDGDRRNILEKLYPEETFMPRD